VRIQAGAVGGVAFTLEASSDLENWQAVTSGVTATDGRVQFVDQEPPSLGPRRYRLRGP